MSLLDRDSEESMFRQTAVYWPPSSPDATGQPTWGAPVALPCRWKDSSATGLTARDQEDDAGATVRFPQAVAKGGMLLLGELESGMTTDARSYGAREIMDTGAIPDRDNESTLYTASLARR